MRLILVRHGQTRSNVTGVLDTGAPGAPLTALGRRQAEALPAALARHPVEAVVASPLVRTQQTAAPLAAHLGLPVRLHEGLREILAGDLEMRGDPESVQTYLGTASTWPTGRRDLRMPGGESGVEVYARYDAAIADVASGGFGTAVLVSHGAVIRSWCAARAGVPVGQAFAHPLPNTGVVVVDGDLTSGWATVSWPEPPPEHASAGVRLEQIPGTTHAG